MLPTIAWTGSAVRLLDQTRLPTETVFLDITTPPQMWDAIKRLVVRGAPAIGVAAAFGVYLGLAELPDHATSAEFLACLESVGGYLKSSRPTAVNLAWAVDRVSNLAKAHLASTSSSSSSSVPRNGTAATKLAVLNEANKMLEEDRVICRQIGEHGVSLLTPLAAPGETISVLTHCNAGSLAAVAYGTALAPIYVGAERGLKFQVYSDETRPLLQGSRLTAFELQANNIPVTVICDNMAASVMQQGKVKAVIVGTDRVAANGDVANKIGTLGVAILARHFNIPFYVAAPLSSIDLNLPTGDQIPIEQRNPTEITQGFGKPTAPNGVAVYNPAFDVTPANLVTAIITEKGVVKAPYTENLKAAFGR